MIRKLYGVHPYLIVNKGHEGVQKVNVLPSDELLKDLEGLRTKTRVGIGYTSPDVEKAVLGQLTPYWETLTDSTKHLDVHYLLDRSLFERIEYIKDELRERRRHLDFLLKSAPLDSNQVKAIELSIENAKREHQYLIDTEIENTILDNLDPYFHSAVLFWTVADYFVTNPKKLQAREIRFLAYDKEHHEVDNSNYPNFHLRPIMIRNAMPSNQYINTRLSLEKSYVSAQSLSCGHVICSN